MYVNFFQKMSVFEYQTVTFGKFHRIMADRL